MFSKYGYDNFLLLLLLSLAILVIGYLINKTWISYPMFAIGAALGLLTLWFFRDPERALANEAKENHAFIVAPSDGKVVQITEIFEEEYLKTEAIQISIFLSPLDVHVNRYPASGLVEYVKYYPGEYLVAWHPKSSELNERSVFGISTAKGKVLYKQITGFLARRVVFDTNVGDKVQAGDKFGMMKFGSRMDVVVPKGSTILVKQGDVVTASSSIIAEMK